MSVEITPPDLRLHRLDLLDGARFSAMVSALQRGGCVHLRMLGVARRCAAKAAGFTLTLYTSEERRTRWTRRGWPEDHLITFVQLNARERVRELAQRMARELGGTVRVLAPSVGSEPVAMKGKHG